MRSRRRSGPGPCWDGSRYFLTWGTLRPSWPPTAPAPRPGPFFWWGSVFLVAVPVMALLLVLGPLLLPEFRDPDAGRLDIVSAAMSLAAVLPVVYGLKGIAQD